MGPPLTLIGLMSNSYQAKMSILFLKPSKITVAKKGTIKIQTIILTPKSLRSSKSCSSLLLHCPLSPPFHFPTQALPLLFTPYTLPTSSQSLSFPIPFPPCSFPASPYMLSPSLQPPLPAFCIYIYKLYKSLIKRTVGHFIFASHQSLTAPSLPLPPPSHHPPHTLRSTSLTPPCSIPTPSQHHPRPFPCPSLTPSLNNPSFTLQLHPSHS